MILVFNFGWKIVVVSANYVMMAVAYYSAIFYIGGLTTQLALRFGDYLNAIFYLGFKKSMTFATKVTAQLFMYRHIQCLANLNNIIGQKFLLGVVVTDTVAIAFCFLGLLRLKLLHENIAVVFVIGALLLNSIICLLVLSGGLVHVYIESKLVLCKLKRVHIYGFDGKWKARFLKSCPFIKTKIGANNFLEEQTPLNLIDVALQLTVEILLSSK